MLLEILLALVVLCSVVPAVLFVVNLGRYKLPRFGNSEDVRVTVLIPARDEEQNIGACLRSVLASREVDLQVLVLDDDSADRTMQIVLDVAKGDGRVGLLRSGVLPRGWNGKQHACWQLAQMTNAPLLLFLDADVRLDPWALARCVATLRKKELALLTGFPRQITVGFLEWLLLPLIHFVLLAYLPMGRMRKSNSAAYAAGCGQFLLVEREAYFDCGGHAAIRQTRHDGLRLPKLFREHGYSTDLVDLTTLAEVRMYDTAGAVWSGLTKNATEGIGSPARIVPFTLLLVLGQIVPLIAAVMCVLLMISVTVVGATYDDPLQIAGFFLLIGLSLVCSFVPRLIAVRRFKQPLKSAWLHPLGVALLLVVQWWALLRQVVGRPVGWRTRTYSSGTGEEVG